MAEDPNGQQGTGSADNGQQGASGTEGQQGTGSANVSKESLTEANVALLGKIENLEKRLAKTSEESKSRRLKLEEYESEKKAAAKKKLEGETDVEKVRGQLNKEMTELALEKDGKIKTLTGQLRMDRVDSVIAKASARHNAVKPDQVIQLIRHGVGLDDSLNPYVIDKDGSARIGEGGRNMSIDAFVKEFLDENPNLVRGSQNAGSGSGKAGSGKDTGITRQLIKDMSMEQWQKDRKTIMANAAKGNVQE
jgi:hypothetical protein